MKDRIYKTLKIFPVVLPIIFALYFFGYAPPKYNVELYTDNIVGEGLGSVYLCTPTLSFSHYYRAYFYFGSQLKHVTINGFHYNVDALSLQFSDVTEADILGFDVSIFGIPLGHYSMDMLPAGEYETADIAPAENGAGAHVTFHDAMTATEFSLDAQFLPAWFWALYWGLFLLVTLLVSLGISFLTERFPAVVMPLLSASAIVVVMVAGCFFCGSLPFVDYTLFLLNWLFLASVGVLIGSVTLPFLGVVLTMGFTLFWYVANYYVILFRNKPVMPADLKAIGTAKEVLGGYTLTPTWQMVAGIALTALYMAAVVWFWKYKQKTGWTIRQRGVGVAASILLLFLCVHNPVYDSVSAFQWDAKVLNSFHKNGMVVAFLKSVESASVSRPDGYSAELANSFLADYQAATEEETTPGVQPVNIIMVMNEAFSDLRTAGLNKAIDVMPFIDSLDENVTKGTLFVSVYGGGTCNTEFESLTGNTLAFFGSGAYPYTENVTKPMFSLASYFKQKGYITNAFHANEAKNWNRETVYPNLGFDAFYSIDDYRDFGEIPTLHTHPADIADYQYIKATSEELTGTPRFLFNVTMQNHAPYDRWENVPEAESVKQNGVNLNFDAKVYLSLVKVSDDAVRELVEAYQDYDEPTMIIFFGDHEPSLYNSTKQQIYTTIWAMNRFQTKFFIWTNYETEAEPDVQISANYLPWLILERGNFPLPPYVRMLKEVHEKYPVISSQGVVDADGVVYGSVAELADDPLIQKYQYVQYANLFDELDAAWFTP